MLALMLSSVGVVLNYNLWLGLGTFVKCEYRFGTSSILSLWILEGLRLILIGWCCCWWKEGEFIF